MKLSNKKYSLAFLLLTTITLTVSILIINIKEKKSQSNNTSISNKQTQGIAFKSHNSNNSIISISDPIELSIEDKIKLLIEYLNEHGFDEASKKISGFKIDQERYQATKVLSIIATEKEPRKVFDYLSRNNKYLLSDNDIIQSLMGSDEKLFDIDDKINFANLLPTSSNQINAYISLLSRLSSPINLHKLIPFISSIKDNRLISHMESTLPQLLYINNDSQTSYNILKQVQKHGNFNTWNALSLAGESYANKNKGSFDALLEIEKIDPNVNNGLLHGYIEQAMSFGYNDSSTLDFTIKKFLEEKDDGSLLSIAFSYAVQRNPEATLEKLTNNGVTDWYINSLINRNFDSLATNHERFILEYIKNQESQHFKDILNVRLNKNKPYINYDNVKNVDNQIIDKNAKIDYLNHALGDMHEKSPDEAFKFISNYKESDIKQKLIRTHFMNFVGTNFEQSLELVTLIKNDNDRKDAYSNMIRLISGDEIKTQRVRSLSSLIETNE